MQKPPTWMELKKCMKERAGFRADIKKDVMESSFIFFSFLHNNIHYFIEACSEVKSAVV